MGRTLAAWLAGLALGAAGVLGASEGTATEPQIDTTESLERERDVREKAGAVQFEWVRIGDPGNPADHLHTDPWHPLRSDDRSWDTYPPGGSVGYVFHVAKDPVRLFQYVAFLNAVAVEGDPNDLVDELDDPFRCDPDVFDEVARRVYCTPPMVVRHGEPGSYRYEIVAGFENHGVTVHPFSGMRFLNWLHNGQPTGPQAAQTTESGAYDCTFEHETHGPPGDCVPQANGRWSLPGARYRFGTLDEIHKAAFWNPGTQQYHAWPTMKGVTLEDTPVSCSPKTVPCTAESEGNQVNRSGTAYCENTAVSIGCEWLPEPGHPTTTSPMGVRGVCGSSSPIVDQVGETGDRPDFDEILAHPIGWWGHAVGDCRAGILGGTRMHHASMKRRAATRQPIFVVKSPLSQP